MDSFVLNGSHIYNNVSPEKAPRPTESNALIPYVPNCTDFCVVEGRRVVTECKNGVYIVRNGQQKQRLQRQACIQRWMVSNPDLNRKRWPPSRKELERLHQAIILDKVHRAEYFLYRKGNKVNKMDALTYFWNKKWRSLDGKTIVIKSDLNPYMR